MLKKRVQEEAAAFYADKLLSAMQSRFGGHAEKTTTPKGAVS